MAMWGNIATPEQAKEMVKIHFHDTTSFNAPADNGEPVLNKGFQNWNFLVLNMAAWLDNMPVVTEF